MLSQYISTSHEAREHMQTFVNTNRVLQWLTLLMINPTTMQLSKALCVAENIPCLRPLMAFVR